MKWNDKLKAELKKLDSSDFVLAALGAILVITIILCFDQYRELARSGTLRPPVLPRHHDFKRPNNVSDIRPWMTFGYINNIFHLPPNLLQTNLKISGQQYAKLSLSAYALRTHQNQMYVVSQVQKIVQDYQTNSSTPSTQH